MEAKRNVLRGTRWTKPSDNAVVDRRALPGHCALLTPLHGSGRCAPVMPPRALKNGCLTVNHVMKLPEL